MIDAPQAEQSRLFRIGLDQNGGDGLGRSSTDSDLELSPGGGDRPGNSFRLRGSSVHPDSNLRLRQYGDSAATENQELETPATMKMLAPSPAKKRANLEF